jgi:hypothetical protein
LNFVAGGDDHPPVANAGADQITECHTPVTLTAAQSSDPDNDVLTCEWRMGNVVLGTNMTLTASFDIGLTFVVLKVTDPCGASSEDTVAVTVSDTTAPTITSMPAPVTVPTGPNCQGATPNFAPQILATDNCSPVNDLVITQNPPAGTPLGIGQHPVTLTVTDASGNSTVGSTYVTVLDALAPTIQTVTPSLNTLWPPNHQLMPITVSVIATDNCDASPVSRIISITANEPTAPGEIQITGDLTATLAAAKNPSGSERIYTLTVQCADASGNRSTATTTVRVPKTSNSKK